ncbi:hypothetical protein V6N13_122455 [Hibiscus sabdariffa]
MYSLSIVKIMAPPLQVEDKAKIFPLKNEVFLFNFPGEQQLLSILRRGPWLFDGEPFVMVRIHELPLSMMTMDMAHTIGAQFVGIETRTVIATDAPNNDHMVLPRDLDRGTLPPVIQPADSSCVMQLSSVPTSLDVIAAMKAESHGVITAAAKTMTIDEGNVDPKEGVVKRVSSSHRCKSLPPNDGSKLDFEEVARLHKRSRHEKHRSSSSTKRFCSENDLVDAIKENFVNLEMVKAIM